MTTQRFPNSRISTSKGASIVVWLLGAYTTSIFVKEVGIAEPVCFFIGVVVQFFLTKAQAPFWRAGKRLWLAMVALVFDAAFNTAGIWPFMKNLGDTSFWSMMSEWVGNSDPPTVATRIVVTVITAIITSAAPEILWEQVD